MWGGRFESGPNELLEKMNTTISVDASIFAEDIEGSIAHALMLSKCEIISAPDCESIVTGLQQIFEEFKRGDLELKKSLEDVHMNVEFRLSEIIGNEVAGKLHTARSRNDQVAVDTKLWTRRRVVEIDGILKLLIRTLATSADEHAEAVMPGFTHLQNAQPITLGHHLLAYAEMFYRDRTRFRDQWARLSESPLGAGALAGTSFPIDPSMTARLLGFDFPMRNSVDAVSDRDFMLEFMSAASIAMIHASRLSEEIVLWASLQFGYIELPDGLTAGSSIMPQKKNPDVAELVRAQCARAFGNLTTLSVAMKGLPLSYSRDMQEDKRPFFDTVDITFDALIALRMTISDSTWNTTRMFDDASRGNTLATDIADWLVRDHGLPFRRAHQIVGRCVAELHREGLELCSVSVAKLAAIDELFESLPDELLDVRAAVERRSSPGGTSPSRVRNASRSILDLNEGLPTLRAGASSLLK